MIDALNAQTAFITLFSAAFMAALYALIMIISLLRRLRQAVQPQAPVPIVTDTAPLMPARRATAEYPRVPVQSVSLEQVVLSIEPDDEPTDDQRNVHKLIEFLKRETVLASST